MQQRAFGAVVIAAIMAGSSGVFVKHMTMSATSISFIRTLVPTVLLGSLMWYKGIGLFRGNYRLMLGASVINALRMYFFFTAYLYTSIGNAVIISYSWPIFVAIFSIFFLGEMVTRGQFALMGMAFAGILIVYANQEFSFENQDFVGMLAALGAAVAHATAVTIFKRESDNYSRTEIIFYQNCMSVLIFLPFFLSAPFPSLQNWTLAGSHAILLGIIGFNFFFFGLKHLRASIASAIAYLEIISALLFSYFWMNEAITVNMLLGGAVIVASTLLLRYLKR